MSSNTGVAALFIPFLMFFEIIMDNIFFHTGFPVLMSLASVGMTKLKSTKHRHTVESALDLLPSVLLGNR
jgi:hypothetical protein